MSQYALRLPDSLFEAARKCADEEHVSMNQLFVVAIAEKISVFQTEHFFTEKGMLADSKSYSEVLNKVKDVSPMPGDEIE